jgi:hypothetical protein
MLATKGEPPDAGGECEMRTYRSATVAAVSMIALMAGTPAAAESANQIEELVVTAQKREQNLQDVPIAVSAFSEAALDRVQIEDATDIQLSIPNTVLTGNDRFTLRGVGNNALGIGKDLVRLFSQKLTPSLSFEQRKSESSLKFRESLRQRRGRHAER